MYTPFCVWLRVPARGLIRVSWLALRLPEGFGPYEDDEYLGTASDVIWSDDFFIDVDTYDVPSEDPYRYPGGTSVTSLLLRNWLLLPI